MRGWTLFLGSGAVFYAGYPAHAGMDQEVGDTV